MLREICLIFEKAIGINGLERCWPTEPQNTGFCREDALEPLLYKAFRYLHFFEKAKHFGICPK